VLQPPRYSTLHSSVTFGLGKYRSKMPKNDTAMMWRLDRLNVPDIVDAIDDELAETDNAAVFTVESKELEQQIWKLHIKPEERPRARLEESLEGHTVWWPGPPKGTADVLSVIPDDLQINLRFASHEPPNPGERLFVYPPRYLEPLRNLWNDPPWASAVQSWIQQSVIANHYDAGEALAPTRLPCPLRTAQRSALQLPGWTTSFLWGPPGTGKTYTVGALLAMFMVERPWARVLLLSTTNSAVDQALVSVDSMLERYGLEGQSARNQCQRVGDNFIISRYLGREHLLPGATPELVRQLATIDAARPNRGNVTAYAIWKRQAEQLRAKLRQRATDTLSAARLSALTTTSATFHAKLLRGLPRYDLIVFDEASQVSLAQALALSPLGRRVIFAGDPEQLLPIVQSQGDNPQRWLGQSMFVARQENHGSTCFLDEQSRMIGPVSAIVGGVFYGGKLKVAEDVRHDQQWLKWRESGGGRAWTPPHVLLEAAIEPGQWSKTYGGPIRYSSTEWIIRNIESLLIGVDAKHVIVLTPFRAQQALLRKRLRAAGFASVRVSTIHRAQGSEEHTVIFDPVDGSSRFFDMIGQRLVNVALSRAQARLVLLISAADMGNAILRRVAELVGTMKAKPRDGQAIPNLVDLQGLSEFPGRFLGTLVRIAGRTGRLNNVDNTSISLSDSETGQIIKYKTAVLLPSLVLPVNVRELSLEERARLGGHGDLRRLQAIEEDQRNRRARELTRWDAAATTDQTGRRPSPPAMPTAVRLVKK
jgi:hypothetical protein